MSATLDSPECSSTLFGPTKAEAGSDRICPWCKRMIKDCRCKIKGKGGGVTMAKKSKGKKCSLI